MGLFQAKLRPPLSPSPSQRHSLRGKWMLLELNARLELRRGGGGKRGWMGPPHYLSGRGGGEEGQGQLLRSKRGAAELPQ